MLEDTPRENQASANWYADDIPKLRMVVEKAAEPKPLTIRPVDLRLPEPQPTPRRARSTQLPRQLQKAVLVVAGVALAVSLLYFAVDRLLVARVVLPSDTAAAQSEARHTLRRYLWSSPQRGDRVVTSDHSNLAVKRVIARPSDWLKLRDGVVYINGKKIDERLTPESHEKLLQLGANQYYVVGGPETGGALSHGVVHKKDIVGRLAD